MTDHPFRYSLYGMVLACDVPVEVPGLCRIRTGVPAGPPDVEVDWIGVTAEGERAAAGGLGPPPGSKVIEEATGGWLAVSRCADALGVTTLCFGYAAHRVQFDVAPGGTRIGVTWTSGVLPVYVSTLLFSTVMGYMLHSQGRLALHAGVVSWRGVAFVLAGVRSAGKSTTIGALTQRGCVVVSDDVAALTRSAAGWAVFPGLTGMRLTSEAQMALGIPETAGAPLWPRSPNILDSDYAQIENKAVISFGEEPGRGTADVPVPLAGVFLLPHRDGMGAPHITAVPAPAAVPHLAANVLTPAWLEPTIDQQHFLTLADVARSLPVRMVARPDNLAALPQLCDALLVEMDRLRP